MSYFLNGTTIPQLPVEIHFEILKYVINSEHDKQDTGARGNADDEDDEDDESNAGDEDTGDDGNDEGDADERASDDDEETEDDYAEGDTDDEGDLDDESIRNDHHPAEEVVVRDDESHGEPITGLDHFALIEHKRYDLFRRYPYNYALVCQMWLSILKKFPKCWREVSIDIAFDPKRFLDIFLWSKGLDKLKVTVINSHTPDPRDASYQLLERDRVSAIVDALRPHISRCETITFQVALLTSLPSPVIFLLKDAPDLINVNLECRIDNTPHCESGTIHCNIGVRGPIRNCASFPSLKRLSMTGFWFMFLASHAYTAEWLKELKGNNDAKQRIAYDISQFQFQASGPYTLENFVMYCSRLHPSTLGLHHLSLNHQGPLFERASPGSPRFRNSFAIEKSGPSTIFLEDVAPNVLETLFFLDEMSPDCLTIRKCTLPDVVLPSRANELILEHISPTPPTLNRILEQWKGSTLSVDSCPSFDDSSLSILAKCSNWTPRHLYVLDCRNFTVSAVRKLCEARNQVSIERRSIKKTRSDYCPVILVSVDGYSPFLSQEDREWFKTSRHARPIQVDWCCQDPENPLHEQDFYKDEHKSFMNGVRVRR